MKYHGHIILLTIVIAVTIFFSVFLTSNKITTTGKAFEQTHGEEFSCPESYRGELLVGADSTSCDLVTLGALDAGRSSCAAHCNVCEPTFTGGGSANEQNDCYITFSCSCQTARPEMAVHG